MDGPPPSRRSLLVQEEKQHFQQQNQKYDDNDESAKVQIKLKTGPFNSPKQRKKLLQCIKQPITRIFSQEKLTQFEVKQTLYWDFIHLVNFSNQQIVSPNSKESFVPYRAVITKANNGAIVRGCLRNRWWWVLCDKDEPHEKIQLLWSSWKKQKFVKQLKSLKQIQPQIVTEIDEALNYLLNRKSVDTFNKKQISNLNEFRLNILRQMLNDNQIQQIIQKNRGQMSKTGQFDPFIFDRMDKNLSLTIQELHPETNYRYVIPNSHWKLHNHLETNSILHSKKHLLNNLKQYYKLINQNPFDFIPLTFHICNGHNDKEFLNFKETYRLLKLETDTLDKMGGTVWIVKPGENSNRGVGIQVCSKIQDIQNIITQKDYHSNGKRFTYIIQKYIERPMLFNKRKFDIRCYLLITAVNGKIKAFWYRDGYVRTSSKEYSLKNLENRMVHLTNDAVQKKCEDYGKFEFGNKISLEDFQRYIEKQGIEMNFFNEILPKMSQMALDSVRSVSHKLDQLHRISTFELFGLDFMLDESLKPWLIEFNANPCLEISCSVLNRIIPALIENIWKIAIDPLFPPPVQWPKSKQSLIPDNPYFVNKFDLIFDEMIEGPYLSRILQYGKNQIPQEEISDDDICDDD